MDGHADRKAPHTRTQPHTTGLYNISPFLSFTDAKQVQSSGPSHFQLCSDQYLSVIQEATTINQNEKRSTEKILSGSYNYGLFSPVFSMLEGKQRVDDVILKSPIKYYCFARWQILVYSNHKGKDQFSPPLSSVCQLFDCEQVKK